MKTIHEGLPDDTAFDALLTAAREAALKSYSPYSRFRVGAALLGEDGSIVSGTNVENRSYGLTQCAERSAVGTAVAAGWKRIAAAAVYSPDASYPLPPCGACRQVLSEFGAPEMPVVCADASGARVVYRLDELYPHDALVELKKGV